MRATDTAIGFTDGRVVVDEDALAAPGGNTRLRLAYRDAANWKSVAEWVLSGRMEAGTVRMLAGLGAEGPSAPLVVYPQNLGLAHPLTAEGGGFDPSLDAPDCEIAHLPYTDAVPSGPVCDTVDAAGLEARIAAVAAEGWDEDAALRAFGDAAATFRPGP